MRWFSPTVAVATILGVAVLGFTPTSAGLSNGVDPLQCRAVLAPIEGASLSTLPSTQQRRVQQQWFVASGYIENEQQSATDTEQAEAAAQFTTLCEGAQHTRSVWMALTAVFGLALAFATRGGHRAEVAVTKEKSDG